MTTLRMVVKEVMDHENLKGDVTSVAKSLAHALHYFGFEIHNVRDKECIQLKRVELGSPMTPDQQIRLMGKSVDGVESPSPSPTSPGGSSS